jgi:predicted permease
MIWWRRMLRRRQMEEQLEKELRFHLDQHAADLIARGSSPEEARRQARLVLGGPEQVKEECRDARGTRWLEDLGHDLRHTLRTMRQKPGFTAVALATLTLGIGATTVMFTVTNGVLLKPLAYPGPDRLVAVHSVSEKFGENWGVSNPDFLDLKRPSHSLALAAWSYSGGTISAPGEPEYVDGRTISAELLSVLGIRLAQGRAFRSDEDRPGAARVAIVSFALWQRRYGGSPSAVGSHLWFDGKPYTVIGVAPPGFQLDGEAGVFTPLGQATDQRMRNRAARILHVAARLRSGFSLAEAQAELQLMARQLAAQYPVSNANLSMAARPLRQELVGDVRSTLWLLLAAVGVVLLIACANIASLLLARAVSRERELAMRVALGAGRGRLARQCLTESAVLGICGGALGLLLAAAGTRPFVAFWPGSLPRAEEIRLDSSVWLFAAAASLVSSLLFGLAPALRAPVHALEQTLRCGARNIAGPSRRMQSAFAITEVALAIVLLVAAGAMGRTLLNLSSLNPGMDAHNVLTARFAISPTVLDHPEQIPAAWQEVLDRARHVPGVESAALVDIVPMRGGINTLPYSTSASLQSANQAPVALASSATPDYLNVMRIPLLSGRFFNEHDYIDAEPVIVIDEVLARHAFGAEDPVGKRLWVPALSRTAVRIVGVVGHVRYWGLAGDDQSAMRDQMYYPFAQVPHFLLRFFSSVMSITVRTSIPPPNILEPLRRALRGPYGDQALYEIRTMDQLVSDSLARQRFLLLLFGVFAGLALLLACIGIYGVLAYLTSRRVPEIGVRIALGANPREVVWLVLRQSLRMILAGAAAGVCAAGATGRVLQRLVQGMRATEPSTFLLMISVLAVAALLASFLPAWRASRVDPVKALRQE